MLHLYLGASTINKPQLQKNIMTNNLHKTFLEIKRENALLKEEISTLKEEKVALEKDNAKLNEKNNNLMDKLRSAIDQCQRLIKHIEEEVPKTISLAEILAAIKIHESYQESIALLQQNEMDFTELNEKAMSIAESLRLRNEKYTNAPNVKHQIADDFWTPWREKFDAYIAKEKEQGWALNRIQEEVAESGLWLQKTKNKHSAPNIGTVRRQMLTDRD